MLFREGICNVWHSWVVIHLPHLRFTLSIPPLPLIPSVCTSPAWSCPCQQLFLWPHGSSLPVVTEPSSAPVCPALPCSRSLSAGRNKQLPQSLREKES